MKIYLKVSFTYFLLAFLSVSILFGQPRRIEDIISNKTSVKLHYELALSAIYQKDFSTNLLKSTKAKRQYYNQLKSLSKSIEIDTLKSEATVNVIIKIKKGSELNPSLVSIHNTFPGKDCDFVTATIPIANLETVSELDEIIGIEPSFKTVNFLNESSKDIHATEVWIGGNVGNPLPDKISGKGVYVGIIDGQPNRDHITFQDKDGVCRFNEFNNSAPNHHGTFVAGIAAGRGNNHENDNFRGIAYESKLLWFPRNDTNTDLDLFKQMIDISGDSPLVVNCSRGYVFGPRDGTSFYEQALDTMIKGNKIFIAAAANNSTRNLSQEEMTYMHYQGVLPNTIGEYLEFDIRIKGVKLPIEIWHSNNIDVKVSNNHQPLKWSDPISEGQIKFFDPENSDDFITIFNQASNIYSSNNPYTDPQPSKSPSHVISIQFNSEDDIFEKGIYKIRLYPQVFDNNVDRKIDAYICYNQGESGGFLHGNNYQTICSPGGAKKVITVAACRKQIDGGDISSYSSLGPLRNDPEGIVSKPDITAPGGDSSPYKSLFSGSELDNKTFVGDIGTSFAAPHITGSIALLMQCFPQLTEIQVKEILQKSAGPIPTPDGGFKKVTDSEDRKYWGAGKLDILEAYKSMAGFSYEKLCAYDEDKFKAAFETNLNAGLPFGPVNCNWENNANYSYQKFTNGAIFLNNQETNAYWLGEGIWQKWIELNSVNSQIGLPLSSEFNDAQNNNNPTVKFQNGEIYWTGSEAKVKYYINVSSGDISNLEYFFDSDPGQGKGIAVNVSPSEDFSQGFDLDYSGLSEGNHTLFVRAKDGSGAWGLLASKQFYASHNDIAIYITQMEYFYDSDPGFSKGTPISVDYNDWEEQNFMLDFTGLNEGYHTLFVRAKNNQGIWGNYATTPFYCTIASNPNNITDIEYYIDSDPGVGMATIEKVTPTQFLTYTVSPNIQLLPPGGHKIGIRVKNGYSIWSDTIEKLFSIKSPPIADAGVDQLVYEGDLVTLDGTKSYSPDNDSLTYFWTTPNGIELSSDSAAKPTFIAPQIMKDTTYTFALTVSDGLVYSAPVAVKVNVVNIINVGLSASQKLPLIRVYPNPSTGIFHIELENNVEGNVKIEVYNSVGVKVHCEEDLNKKHFSISLPDKSSGIYFIRISTIRNQYTQKLQIQNTN